jgi:hypothetical protein
MAETDFAEAPPAPPPTPPPAPPSAASAEFRTPEQHLYAMAAKYGVDPKLALAVLRRESAGRQTDASGQPLQSSQGAQGMFQLLPATAHEFGLDPTDPFQNIEAGIRYLRQGIDRGDGTVRSVAAYYHGGPNQQQWGPKTAAYAQGVEDDLRQQLAAQPAAQQTPAQQQAPVTAPAAKPKPSDWSKPENIAAAALASPGAPPTPPWYQRAASTLSDVGIGALKGAGDTATNLGALVHKIPGVDQATDALWNLPPGGSQQAFVDTRKDLESSNTAQKVGKFIEQGAELIAPAGEIGKLGKAAQVASKLGPYASAIPRIAVEAAGGAGMAAAQGGSPTTGAAFGAAAPVVGAIAEKGAEAWGGALRDKAGKLIEQAFAGTSQRYKAMVQKRVQEVLDRGLWGSQKSMLKEAQEALVPATQAIDDIMHAHANDVFTGSNEFLRYIESVKDRFRRFVPSPQGMKEVVIDSRPYTQLTRLQRLVTELGPHPTMEDMVTVRKVWDGVVSDIGGFAHRAPGAIGLSLREQTEEWAKFKGANFLRGLIGHDLPDVVKPNREFSFWKDIADTLSQTLQRQGPQSGGISQSMGHLASATAGALAAAGGFGTGHSGTEAGLAGVGTAAAVEASRLVVQAMRSPAWRTASAQVRDALAKALTSGAPETIADLATQIIGSKVAAPPPPPATGQGRDIALPPPAPPR